MVDVLSHDGRQRRRDGRPDLGGGAGAQRHAGHVGVGDRRWAAAAVAWAPHGAPRGLKIGDTFPISMGESGEKVEKNMEQKKLTVNDHDISLVWNFWMNF